MSELGHGDGYRYAHDEPDGFAAGANYFPETVTAQQFYQPVERGLEIRIKEAAVLQSTCRWRAIVRIARHIAGIARCAWQRLPTRQPCLVLS